MPIKYQVNKEKVLFAKESFAISGACFYCQNTLGRFAKEKQYGDLLEQKFKELEIPFKRELVAGSNRTDFVIFDKILVELKAKPFLSKEDFNQAQRYLDVLDLDLGLLINFGHDLLNRTEYSAKRQIRNIRNYSQIRLIR